MEGQFSDLKSSSQDSQSFIGKNAQNTQEKHPLTKRRTIINCKTLPKYKSSSNNQIQNQLELDSNHNFQKIPHLRSGSDQVYETQFNFIKTYQSSHKNQKISENSNNLLAIECVNVSDEDDSVLYELNELLTETPQQKGVKNVNNKVLELDMRPQTSVLTNHLYKTHNFQNQNQVFTLRKLGNGKIQNKLENQITKNQQLYNNWMSLSPRSSKNIINQQKFITSKKETKSRQQLLQVSNSNNQHKQVSNIQGQQIQLKLNQQQFQKPKTPTYQQNNVIHFNQIQGNLRIQNEKGQTLQQPFATNNLNRNALQGFHTYNIVSARNSM